jgi:CheY-like chemotaxis protein
LIADDNADMREYLYRLLGDTHAVECVGDGTTALRRALASPPDLVLTDIMMPGLDGFQLLTALRADPSTRLIPVILLSARAGEEAKVEGLDVGADDYLVKPFTARELTARVRANLELSHLRQEAMRLEQAARQHAERERERLRELFEQAPAIMCILSGPEHIFTLANTRYLQVIGNRSIIGKPIREALPEIENQGFLELLDAVYATGEPVVGREARTLLARGPGGSLEEAFFDYIYAAVRDAAGNIESVFVSGPSWYRRGSDSKPSLPTTRGSTWRRNAPVASWTSSAAHLFRRPRTIFGRRSPRFAQRRSSHVGTSSVLMAPPTRTG